MRRNREYQGAYASLDAALEKTIEGKKGRDSFEWPIKEFRAIVERFALVAPINPIMAANTISSRARATIREIGQTLASHGPKITGTPMAISVHPIQSGASLSTYTPVAAIATPTVIRGQWPCTSR